MILTVENQSKGKGLPVTRCAGGTGIADSFLISTLEGSGWWSYPGRIVPGKESWHPYT
jgi:hypothetical protein